VARIAGVDLPRTKRIEIALTYLYGIGRSSARKILLEADVDWDRKAGDLADEELQSIRQILDAKYKIEGDLRRDVLGNVKRLMDLGCYRGLRHRKGPRRR
jgi:small subunit ribosomal protein S13